MPAEMMERRRQGLCFNYDDPYVRGHKCDRLFYLEVTDCDEEEVSNVAPSPAQDDDQPLISLYAITGIKSAETMQLHVTIGTHTFTALVDSGSSHNFISLAAARQAGLHFHDTTRSQVVVTNGDCVACHGQARDVSIIVDTEHFTIDCLAIPLDCYDIVLDVTWLKSLGPILWDFDDLRMACWPQGRCVL